jgi:two-component system, OmpR family, sensor kinase
MLLGSCLQDFVADVSHELRTPLTTLRGNLGLLGRNPPASAEEQADILTDMVDESDRLIRLVNDLLQLARADAGRSLVREPLLLLPVLEETIRQARQLDPSRSIKLKKPVDVSVLGDRDAIKQVMVILLDNALKHSEGGIRIAVEEAGSQIEVCVRDDGPGIPADKMEHVFERFYRTEDNRETAGFGLGLPIARSLVEGMGGTITIKSGQESGSTITMCFLKPSFSS